jgi:uncharacterized protein YkwD
VRSVRSARLVPAVALLLCAVLVGPAFAATRPRTARAAACANADVVPASGNLDLVRAAILCLNNEERGARGLPALKENSRLRQAAAGHSGDMVAHRYFAHDAPDGADFVDRIVRAGYVRRDQGSWLGENIAWGTGAKATATEIHGAWMASPSHRANILRRSFREIGIGIALGNPVVSPSDAGATYTADFGLRR